MRFIRFRIDGTETVLDADGDPTLLVLLRGFAAPISAAIANAVFDGPGVRDLPITRERLIAAMELAS